MTIWRNIIFGCLAIIVTLSIYQDNQMDKELAAVKERLDNIHKIQIESSYRRYVLDFIDNDFEAIASHFKPPVDFKSYDFVAKTNEDVINQYMDMKANIQEGYAYSLIDEIGISKTSNNNFLVCADYTRYDSNGKSLFKGRTNYLYIFSVDEGWKINSLDSIDRDENISCKNLFN